MTCNRKFNKWLITTCMVHFATLFFLFVYPLCAFAAPPPQEFSLATVESEFEAGKTLAQIALDHGIAQADLQAFLLSVRTLALQNAVADGVITQAQADRMLQMGGRGFGHGMMNGGSGYGMMGSGTGPCGGTGIPVGGMMQRGGRGQQTNP